MMSLKCPHCGTTIVPELYLVLKSQKPNQPVSNFLTTIPFFDRQISVGLSNFAQFFDPSEVSVNRCVACGKFFFLVDGKVVWPDTSGIPAHDEMPETVKKVFEEAQAIHTRSPRAACVMLRCAAERLVDYLCPDIKGTLASRIATLDISKRCLKILTVARLTGNEAVHGNEIDFSETNDEALARFEAISKGINQVVDETIAQPKKLSAMETAMLEAQNKRKR